MPLLPYYPGNGTKVLVGVRWIGEYPRGSDGCCAFCHGDPCAERSGPETHIGKFYAENPKAETCPMCDGRAT
jgi:hypothetical protein